MVFGTDKSVFLNRSSEAVRIWKDRKLKSLGRGGCQLVFPRAAPMPDSGYGRRKQMKDPAREGGGGCVAFTSLPKIQRDPGQD